MKRILSVITIVGTIHSTLSASHSHKHIDIDSKLIKVIDGDGTLNIAQIVVTGIKLKDLQHGKDKFIYKNKEYTLKELMDVEHSLKKSPHAKETKHLHETLLKAVEYVQEVTSYYRQLVNDHKAGMASVIKQWSKQRNKHNSPLIRWADMEEHEFIKSYGVSAEKLYFFIDDLIMMLEDVRHSCKKSNERFLKEWRAHKQKNDHHDEFDGHTASFNKDEL